MDYDDHQTGHFFACHLHHIVVAVDQITDLTPNFDT